MNINYTWEISHFHVVPSLNNQSNVVTKIAFELHGEYVDENNNSFKELWSGVTLIEFDENSNFITLEEINQEIAEKWVQDSENKKQRNVDWLKNKVKSRLEERVNPTLIVITPSFTKK
jgi:uncharacterized coiled-coil protein SlyX